MTESEFQEYYQRRMKRTIDSFIPVTDHCYMLGKESKVRAKLEKLRKVKEQLERALCLQVEKEVDKARQKYRVLKLHQPIASLLVSGINRTIKAENLPSLYKGDVVFVFAEAATGNSIRGLWANEELYGTYHNALVMEAIEKYEDMPKGCYVGFVKVGQRLKNGIYRVKEACEFKKPVQEITNGINTEAHAKANKPKISFEHRILRVPLNDDLWEQMKRLFWVKGANYDKAIREIYDFLQSAEINKRSSLRGGGIDVGNAGIIRYKSINHDDVWSWQRAIKVYTLGY